jgi:hypothetical protein
VRNNTGARVRGISVKQLVGCDVRRLHWAVAREYMDYKCGLYLAYAFLAQLVR